MGITEVLKCDQGYLHFTGLKYLINEINYATIYHDVEDGIKQMIIEVAEYQGHKNVKFVKVNIIEI